MRNRPSLSCGHYSPDVQAYMTEIILLILPNNFINLIILPTVADAEEFQVVWRSDVYVKRVV